MILRHLRYILTKHTRRIDDDARAHCTPVCMHGKDSSVLHVHTRHACIQRKVRTVLHGILRHGNGQPVRTDNARLWKKQPAVQRLIHTRLGCMQRFVPQHAHTREAQPFPIRQRKVQKRAHCSALEAQVLSRAPERHAQRGTHAAIHPVAQTYCNDIWPYLYADLHPDAPCRHCGLMHAAPHRALFPPRAGRHSTASAPARWRHL